MLRIFGIFLITQLPHSEALPCNPGEYEINGECCPMCGAGSKVVKHCKPSSSTTCMPCVDDTYTEHPNGLTECMRCKVCDAGTEFNDNVCELCPDGTFSATNMSHSCQPWTKCEEEGMIERKAGTATSDAVCVQRGLSDTAMTLIIITVVLIVCGALAVVSFWWKKKRKYGVTPAQETGDESKEQIGRTLIQLTENGTETIP
nr:tumor necrosis factor receptor superfamily member 14 isoform X7 [Chelonoidis abingdonii]